MTNRELDEWIAEHVMGTELETLRLWKGCRESPQVLVEMCDQLPAYSSSIAAAWSVVEKLQAYNPFWGSPSHTGFDLSPTIDVGIEAVNGWTCNFGDDTTRVYAPTAPMAICLAAKKAIESQ